MSDHEWTVEVTPAARAAISRAITDRYDGRELGGALVAVMRSTRHAVRGSPSNALAGRSSGASVNGPP